MFSIVLLFCSLAFAETKTLVVQICLDRAGFSCNTIDGVWGRKCERALQRYRIARGEAAVGLAMSPETAYDRYFAKTGPQIFRIETVTQADLDALVKIPQSPREKAALTNLGYESIREMFAERGHLSPRALERLNPGINWDDVRPGLKLVIPNFPSIDEELSVWPKGRRNAPKRPEAATIRISLSNYEVTAYDSQGRCLALFPCSIARNKSKRPTVGELRITSALANPNYTYTPDFTPRGQKVRRQVLPAGPNCPIGVAWLGLNLPGYGIHGTPTPETIGNAESHGCFRLSNWNAARLYALCKPGTRVLIDP